MRPPKLAGALVRDRVILVSAADDGVRVLQEPVAHALHAEREGEDFGHLRERAVEVREAFVQDLFERAR